MSRNRPRMETIWSWHKSISKVSWRSWVSVTLTLSCFWISIRVCLRISLRLPLVISLGNVAVRVRGVSSMGTNFLIHSPAYRFGRMTFFCVGDMTILGWYRFTMLLSCLVTLLLKDSVINHLALLFCDCLAFVLIDSVTNLVRDCDTLLILHRMTFLCDNCSTLGHGDQLTVFFIFGLTLMLENSRALLFCHSSASLFINCAAMWLRNGFATFFIDR